MNYVSANPNTLEQHWMPFTANRDFKADPRLLVKAEGMYYWNHRGGKVIDGSAGLFCVAAGHGRPEIKEAVADALGELDYAPHFNFGHPASFEVARRVAALAPGDLNYVFFGNSGSEAIESALKIALTYHKVRGQGARQRLIGRERSYHGVNFGGISVGGMVKNKESFGLGLPGVAHIRHTWLPEQRYTLGQPEAGAELADDLQRMVDLHGADNIAACIVEPIAGSTGCLVPPRGYLERLRAICDKHGILLIFDEVICGFGRTGKAFGADSFGVKPDMMTLAKALTNGVVPMGAVVVSENIYETITDAAGEGAVELFHGYTYSGCPAACAASLAAMEIYRAEGLFDRVAKLTPYFHEQLISLKKYDCVTDIRGYGLLGGFDIAPAQAPGKAGYDLLKRLFAAGLLIKTTGDSALISPPLIAEEKHIDEIFDVFHKVLAKF